MLPKPISRAQNIFISAFATMLAPSPNSRSRGTMPNDPRVFALTGFILRRRGQEEEGCRV